MDSLITPFGTYVVWQIRDYGITYRRRPSRAPREMQFVLYGFTETTASNDGRMVIRGEPLGHFGFEGE